MAPLQPRWSRRREQEPRPVQRNGTAQGPPRGCSVPGAAGRRPDRACTACWIPTASRSTSSIYSLPAVIIVVRQFEEGHPTDLEPFPVSADTGPRPFGSTWCCPSSTERINFRAEIRNAGKHGRPVRVHLGPANKGPARVGRLLAAVVLVEQRCCRFEVMRVHRRHQPIHYFTHQFLPFSC